MPKQSDRMKLYASVWNRNYRGVLTRSIRQIVAAKNKKAAEQAIRGQGWVEDIEELRCIRIPRGMSHQAALAMARKVARALQALV